MHLYFTHKSRKHEISTIVSWASLPHVTHWVASLLCDSPYHLRQWRRCEVEKLALKSQAGAQARPVVAACLQRQNHSTTPFVGTSFHCVFYFPSPLGDTDAQGGATGILLAGIQWSFSQPSPTAQTRFLHSVSDIAPRNYHNTVTDSWRRKQLKVPCK
jgi:hypothetical protein